jgi:hypothetical protein
MPPLERKKFFCAAILDENTFFALIFSAQTNFLSRQENSSLDQGLTFLSKSE